MFSDSNGWYEILAKDLRPPFCVMDMSAMSAWHIPVLSPRQSGPVSPLPRIHAMAVSFQNPFCARINRHSTGLLFSEMRLILPSKFRLVAQL